MIVQSIWEFYIPILLFDEKCFKHKLKLLSLFWKFEFFNKFSILYPLKWIEPLYRMSWNFVYTLKVFWYNICANYKAIEKLFFWTGLLNKGGNGFGSTLCWWEQILWLINCYGITNLLQALNWSGCISYSS